MNYKKEELVKQFIETIKMKFPEIELLNILDGPEDPEDVWIHFSVPDDEDKITEISHFASGLSSDILLEYGWLFIICPRNIKYAKAA